MKTLAVLLSLWAFQVHAADECKTVWVYKPYKTCSDPKNGLDLAKATPTGDTKVLNSDPVKGGPHAQAACTAKAKSLEVKLADYAITAEVQSIADGISSRDITQHVTYVYPCTFRLMKVPYKTRGEACGFEDKYSSQTQGTSVALEGRAHCLSCDNGQKTRKELVTCLKETQNIWADVMASGVQVRKDEINVIMSRLDLLVKTSADQMSVEDLGKMIDFKEQMQKELQAR